jgi:drug/metabolite transporter (DMT)-like permease
MTRGRLCHHPGVAMDDPRLLVPLLLVVDSLHYVLARLLVPHLPPSASGFYVMVLSALPVLAFNRGRFPFEVLRRHLVFFLSIGSLVAVSTNLGFAAMRFIDPGTASLLSRMSLVFGLGFGLVWLGERLRAWEVVGAGLALGGVMIVSFQPGDYLRLGSLLILAGTFLYALHAALVKRYGGQMAFLDFFLFRLVSTAAFLLILAVGQGELVWPSLGGWLVVGATGLIDVVISRALYYLALRRLDMSFHTIILTMSPIVTMAWSFALFDSRPSLQEAVGGAAVLAGVLLATASRGGLLSRGRSSR